MSADIHSLVMYRIAMQMPPEAVWDYLNSLGLATPEGLSAGQEADLEQRREAAFSVVSHFVDEDAAASAAEAFEAENSSCL